MESSTRLAWIIAASILLTAVLTPVKTVTATFVTDEGNVSVALEVADEPSERRRGLMNRTSLESDHGMLFVFPTGGEKKFWMKNTLIPLDIIFISNEKEVTKVVTAHPQPDASEEELRIYTGTARYVVEVNAGFAERNGIRPGTGVSIKPDQP